MVNTDTDPALVLGDIVDTVRDRLAELLVHEVIYTNLLGLALRSPFPTAVFEVADQLLFLGVHRDHRLAALLEQSHRGVDVLELGVAIRWSLGSLAIAPESCSLPGAANAAR